MNFLNKSVYHYKVSAINEFIRFTKSLFCYRDMSILSQLVAVVTKYLYRALYKW